MLKPDELDKVSEVLNKLNLEVGIIRKRDLEKDTFRGKRKKSENQLLVSRKKNIKAKLKLIFYF